MKKTLVTALLALTAALTAGAQSRTEVYTFPSEVLGAEKSCTVYLPDGYDRSQESYPVLYLLHGASGCHTDWTQKGDLRRIADEAIAAGMARPMIVVMPDASGEGPKRTGRHMGYFDVPGWDYERFFFEEFMPAVEKRYRIASDKAHRAVAGLSMGGGGTAVYALHHPELLNRTLLLILADAEENAPISLTAEAIGVLLVYVMQTGFKTAGPDEHILQVGFFIHEFARNTVFIMGY